jgi:hypothetical protein
LVSPVRKIGVFYFREMEELGRPRLPWKQELVSSNLAFPTFMVCVAQSGERWFVKPKVARSKLVVHPNVNVAKTVLALV